ncbi:MAG: HAD hydrolase family protein [Candidatus Bathyarchaeota archaeon]|nr:HAD hydrolase family protein [Candidatus Bathyarchaeota archaeon]
MLEVEIPGFGQLRLEFLVCDFTGTISLDGNLLPAVKEKLNAIAGFLKIVVLTADEFGKAEEELKDVKCEVHIVKGQAIDVQKEELVRKLGLDKVVAFGNGLNDRKMLKAARLGIIVLGKEGCAVESLLAADMQVATAIDGLDLLLNPRRLRATLKY